MLTGKAMDSALRRNEFRTRLISPLFPLLYCGRESGLLPEQSSDSVLIRHEGKEGFFVGKKKQKTFVCFGLFHHHGTGTWQGRA
jgi:hypothetical protein